MEVPSKHRVTTVKLITSHLSLKDNTHINRIA